jgi:CheY-like chemotaxis protein
MVTGDHGKFCQILTNYFSNALKYGVPPSASIDVYVLNEGLQRCRVTVAVKNTGPDIPAHEQATLFETFTRGEYAKRGRIGGSGLGLSICKKFAETMGGSVGVTSSGGLTVFQVTIPFEIAQSHRSAEGDAVVTRSLNARALAIEDEDYNRLVLGNILAKLGYKVDWACDGKTALQLAQQNGYDLILTDLMLPDTDGGTLTREILKHCEEPKPPIFAVTAYSTKEKEDECLQAGMAGFISKPITVEKLEASIQGWASRHRTSAKPFVEQSAPTANITVTQLGRLGPLEVILPDFMRKIESEWTSIDRMLEDRECTPAANAAHKLVSAMLLVEADVLSDQLRLLESRLRDGALESEIEKVRSICRDEVANVGQALKAALARHQRFNADRPQK